MEIVVNGKRTAVSPAWREDWLLIVLREALGLVGSKYGCGVGVCGACTVLVDGEPVRSCVLKPADVVGKSITTIEGLASTDGRLSAVQQAWLDEAVSQCGYCQAGQIISATALLKKSPKPTDAEVDAAFANNFCRCGTQQRIRAAVARAAVVAGVAAAGAKR